MLAPRTRGGGITRTDFGTRAMTLGEAILKRELVAALRSPRTFVALAVYAAALSAIALLAWPSGEFDVIYQAERARKLFLLFALAQFVLVTLFSPVFSAGALTQEKEKKSLELLLTAPWSADAVTAGKFLSAVAVLALLVLTSLPILGLSLFLGGILVGEVVGYYLVLLAVASAFGMVGLTCSAYFSRTYAALAVSYLIVLPLGGLVVGLFGTGEGGSIRLASLGEGVTLLILGGAALLGMGLAVARKLEEPYTDIEKSAEEERPDRLRGLVLRRGKFPDTLIWPVRTGELLPDGRNPMRIKEITSEVFGRGTLVVRSLILLSCLVSVVFLFRCFTGEEPVYVAFLVAVNLLMTPAFACNAFTQERERGTLDLLLTTLLTPWEIVGAKLYAAVRCAGALTLYLGTPILLALGFSVLSPAHFSFTPGEAAVHAGILAATIAAAAAIGLFVSQRARTSLAAMIGTYTACFACFALPVIAHGVLETTGLEPSAYRWLLGMSPFSVAYSIGNAEWQKEALGWAPSTPLWPFYIGGYALLAAILVWLTWRRMALFTPEGERKP
jgi:ABC-type transport system involved in multi-copper enzyme maturation permease subunit